MAADNEMRVSDAEREAAATELREHFASGRLDQEELDDRLTAAFAAKTRGDLKTLFADLPSSEREWSGAAGPGDEQSFHAGPGQATGNPQWDAWASTGGRVTSGIAAALCLVPVFAVLLVASLLALGHGRPFGIVFVLAALAVLRRLLLSIFGRRMRHHHGRGPRRTARRRF